LLPIFFFGTGEVRFGSFGFGGWRMGMETQWIQECPTEHNAPWRRPISLPKWGAQPLLGQERPKEAPRPCIAA